MAAVGDTRVGGLYLTLGIWLHSSGMLPRICTKEYTTRGLLASRGASSTICSVSTKFATVPCAANGAVGYLENSDYSCLVKKPMLTASIPPSCAVR